MSFESRTTAFAERFLSTRTFNLVVAPALADLQFEHSAGPRRRAQNRLAVLRAVGGGLRNDLARDCGSFVVLTLVPAGYYIFLMVILFDFFSIAISTGFFVVALLILVLSIGPVMACFWPERRTRSSVELR
jgi:hypothetical protein